MTSRYDEQVALLLEVLPVLNDFPDFALKGGTAINLFYRDMPRRSVDIDLVFLPLSPRDDALMKISTDLQSVGERILRILPGSEIQPQNSSRLIENKTLTIKLDVHRRPASIRIEPNLILRGSVYPPSTKELCGEAQKQFARSVAIQCVSFEDLYAGKMCAALDRQHPRDFFDIHLLMESEGLTEKIIDVFIVYLCSHNRPISEILNPNLSKDFHATFESEFSGMATTPVEADDLIASFKIFKQSLIERLNDNHRNFIISFAKGETDWSLMPEVEHTKEFPSLRWKLLNINKMNASKKLAEVKNLQNLFSK